MKALITGGAGFIGSTLVDRLIADGHDVEVVDNLSSGKRSNLDAATAAAASGGLDLSIHEIDIRDTAVVELIESLRPDVVYHLAAQADVRVSVSDPVLDASINIIGAINVLEGTRRAGTDKIVFASSGGTIYGEPDPSALPVTEAHPLRPESPYGITKRAFTDYLAAYRSLHGLAFTSLALGNVYGPRQDPHGEAGVVSIFAGKLIAGAPCTIFGDGSQTRDFVFVDDVVDAFARAATAGDGLLMNIGTGVEVSVNELYTSMAQAAGVSTPATLAPARVGELHRISLSPALAHEQLGWTAATSLDDGTSAVIEWTRATTP